MYHSSHNRMLQLLDRSADPVVWFTADGRPVHANPAFCELVQNTLPNVLACGCLRHLRPAAFAGVGQTVDLRIARPYGPPIDATANALICSELDGEPLYATVVQPLVDWPMPSAEEAVAAERLARLICADLGRQVGEDIGPAVMEALRLTGQFSSADRCYIFALQEGGTLISNTYEWCAPGVEPQAAHLQRLRVSDYPWWAERLGALEPIYLPTLDVLPPEAIAERQGLEAQGIQSLVILPLMAEGEVAGFIGLDWVRPGRGVAFEQKTLLLRMAGEAVGNALRRHRSEERLVEAHDLSQALNRVNSAAVSSLDRDEILRRVALECREALSADDVTVVLREPTGWVVRYATEGLQPFVGISGSLDRVPLSSRVMRTSQPVFVEDTEREEPDLTAWLRSAGFRASCVLPLLAKDEVMGVIGLNYREPRPFTRAQREFVVHLAATLALALETARLYELERANRQLLEAIMEAVPVGMSLVDADTLEVRWGNPAGAGLLPKRHVGLAAPGVSLPDLVPGFEHTGVRNTLRAVAETGEAYRVAEAHLPWHGHSDSYWNVSMVPVGVEEPGRHVLIVGQEVTSMVQARLRIEELVAVAERHAAALEVERARLRAVIDNAPEAIVVFGADGQVQMANPAADALQSPALLGRERATGDESATLHDAYLEPWGQTPLPVQESATKGTACIGQDLVLVYPDGRRKDIRASSAPIRDQQGALAGAVAMYQDVTDIKAAQRELTALEGMKSDFIASVSHELRTPLAAVKGYADLLMSRRADSLTARQREFVHGIADSGERLESLVNDLLDVSMEDSELVMRLDSVDLGEVVRQAVGRARNRAGAKALKLDLSSEDALPAIEADFGRLGQLFDGLLDNALKFTPVGGAIGVRVGRVDESTLEVSVSDSGEGIPPEEMPALFGRFFRGRNVTRDGVRGTGLGLYNARRIAEMHKGTIEVESELGRGSTFRVRLPIARD